MTKERFQGEGLELVELPIKFVNHWQDEAMRLRDLAEVLCRSLTVRMETSGRGEPRGDETLAKQMEESLDILWMEIEEVSDGRWEPRKWEATQNE